MPSRDYSDDSYVKSIGENIRFNAEKMIEIAQKLLTHSLKTCSS